MITRTLFMAAVLLSTSACSSQCRGLDAAGCTTKGRDFLTKEKNGEKAAAVLTEACDKHGSLEACALIGSEWAADPFKAGIARDDARAAIYLARACDAKDGLSTDLHGAACYVLSLMHEYMRGVSSDPALERTLRRRACATYRYEPACKYESDMGSGYVNYIYDSPEGLGSTDGFTKGNRSRLASLVVNG
jgi:TPR repeat protein